MIETEYVPELIKYITTVTEFTDDRFNHINFRVFYVIEQYEDDDSDIYTDDFDAEFFLEVKNIITNEILFTKYLWTALACDIYSVRIDYKDSIKQFEDDILLLQKLEMLSEK